MNSGNLKCTEQGIFSSILCSLHSCSQPYLDDIPILDDCSQQFSVFSFVLFLFQIRRMLKWKQSSSAAECFTKGVFCETLFSSRLFQRSGKTASIWKSLISSFSSFQQRNFQFPFSTVWGDKPCNLGTIGQNSGIKHEMKSSDKTEGR